MKLLQIAAYMCGWGLGVVAGTAILWWTMWRNTRLDEGRRLEAWQPL